VGWKIKRVVEEAQRLGMSVQDCTKLQDEEISGHALIAMLKVEFLKNIISE
jgi:hypothetical protein